MDYRIFSGFTMESPKGFNTITWLQRNQMSSTESRNWIQWNIPSFISKDIWPARSPDLNPLDFCIRSILKTRVLVTPHISLESLKAELQREWEVIPQEQIRAACDTFVNRFKAVVRNKSRYIE
ncbi:hypothetical protein FHG87_003875 [Trinorchestia longiramus]|nr:hypothetical protein FHG87_003875 [Trinorchestia longiramus]